MSGLPASSASSSANSTSAAAPSSAPPGPGLAGPATSSMNFETMLTNYATLCQPPPPDREHLGLQVQMALSLVPPPPQTDRAAIPVLSAVADLYSSEELPDRAATCLKFANRFAKNPNDDDAFSEFMKECGEWPGLPEQQFRSILSDCEYQHIYDILHPQRVPTPLTPEEE